VGVQCKHLRLFGSAVLACRRILRGVADSCMLATCSGRCPLISVTSINTGYSESKAYNNNDNKWCNF